MNSASTEKAGDCSTTGAGHVRLELRLGPVPSFKNRKRIAGKRLVTDRRVKRWMQAAISSLESQLLCAFRTSALTTPTVAPLPFWIASSLPKDDCWRYVRELTVKTDLCEPGQEGVTITIEPL